MRNAVMFLFVFLAVLVISVNHAVARQWTSDLEYMTCTPGTTQLEFPPRCNRSPRLLSGGGGEDPEAIAGWLIDFLVPMSASQVDAVLAEVDPGGVLGLSGNALKAMSHAELVTLVQSIETEHPSLYASLLQAKSGTRDWRRRLRA